MATVKGHSERAFEKLRDLLAKNVESQEELGASICVNIDGKNVLDIWAGYTDKERTKEWEENTIVNVWSMSKTVTNLAALIAVDRGVLDVHEKVSKYWPEFAENGKQDIEVRHILSHTSGVSAWEKPVEPKDICDLKSSTEKLAKQAPWWTPGTASGYHAVNQGHLVGELIRRTTGKSLKQFIAEEIAGPLGADFQLGARKDDWSRISDLIPPPPMPAFPMDEESVATKTFTGPLMDASFALTEDWRNAEIGAVNGHGNARAVSRILSTVSLGGEVDGVRLLSQKTLDLIFEEQIDGVDLAMGIPVRFGIGFGLPNLETVSWIPLGHKCFWGGWVSTDFPLFPRDGVCQVLYMILYLDKYFKS